ncbi:MAG: 16S rRNA (guanine(966)-N(2))-methyltransferase RsmD [Desulfobacterales bacterium]|nr:16S rRNA (guanine(966)-N(2))-methyltransferase RsmD [Desulfobacterales bacterium]
MRITGGQLRGRVLASLKGPDIRPTTDQVKEAIFSILGQDLSGLRGLDLFAGAGSLGLEALSRGASRVIFIDNSLKAVKLINRHLDLFGLQGSGTVLRRDLRKDIPWGHPLLKKNFDLVFLDPPYGKDLIPVLLKDISTKNMLSYGARIIAETSKTDQLPISFGNLKRIDDRLYGDTRISIYTYEAKQ